MRRSSFVLLNVFLSIVHAANIPLKIPEVSINKTHMPISGCIFSVHKQGPGGEAVSGILNRD